MRAEGIEREFGFRSVSPALQSTFVDRVPVVLTVLAGIPSGRSWS